MNPLAVSPLGLTPHPRLLDRIAAAIRSDLRRDAIFCRSREEFQEAGASIVEASVRHYAWPSPTEREAFADRLVAIAQEVEADVFARRAIQ